MAIFNLNTGEITESSGYPLSNNTHLTDILFSLKDNEDRYISPRFIRDSLLSIWSSVPFKETFITSSMSYIGIDSVDPYNRDIKKRILLGKRSFSGINNYIPSHDIMNDRLLIGASSSDIFFFNTKSDHIVNNTTKISILSGKTLQNYIKSPYIQSQYVSGLSASLSMDVVANGEINISSSYSKLCINNMILPNISNVIGSMSENKTFFYKNGKVVLDEIKFPNTSIIGTQSNILNIIGSNVNINGYGLEFTSIYNGLVYHTPKKVGGIEAGTSFSHVSISDVLRRMIYNYLPPYSTIKIDNNYVEVGTIPSPIINFNIYKRTNNINSIELLNMIPGILSDISSPNYVTRSGSAIGIILSPPISESKTHFIIKINDGVSTATSSTFIKGIYPYFYGFNNNTLTQSDLISLTKSVESLGDKVVHINITQEMINSGNNWFYFIYDYNYPQLNNIIDDDSNIISSLYSDRTFISPNGLWSTKSFRVYRWQILTPISTSKKFEFKY